MLDVAIINSPLFRRVNKRYDEDSLPPIGLGYIATNLMSKGLNVELIDAVEKRIPLKELIATLKERRPKVIAINIFTTNYKIVRDLVQSITDESARIIIGGLSTRELYSKIITWKVKNRVDIVSGDGEHITYDVINDSVQEKPVFEKDNFRVFQVFNGSRYFLNEQEISAVPLDRQFFSNEPLLHPFGFYEANIITSRGCIYNCAFCAAARSLNKNFADRERSIDSVRAELLSIKRHYPHVTSIRVLDDLFLKNSKSIQRGIDTFAGLDLNWRSMAHVQTFRNVSSEIMNQLKDSNCNELFIGIESGSPKILKSIHKTTDIDVIKASMVSIFRAGINAKGYFIYGFPEETEEDMQQTYELATYLRDAALAFGVQFRTSPFQFRPYHGTELYNNLKKQALLNDDVSTISLNHAISDSIGRQQFNFHSGNFSKVDKKTLYNYICATAMLNPANLFDKARVKIG